LQVTQKKPTFTAVQWDGTPEGQAAVAELVAFLKEGLTYTWSTSEDGSLVGVPNFGRPFVIRPDHYLVHGPAWGDDAWVEPGGGDRPSEICSPELFANKYETVPA
jgi:hypothetical protein